MNNRPHQTMAPLSILLAEQPFYAYPYAHLPAGPGDVLIVGAGSGNDVALALSEGATHVDAVEIDPVLQRLGRDLHPGASVPGPARERAHRRRPGLPGADPRPIRPDPVRPARFAHVGVGAGRAAAGELPVHDGGDADRARPSASRRGVLDVQLLPPRRVRALRRHPHAGVRPRAVHRSRRAGCDHPLPVGAHDRAASGLDHLRLTVRGAGQRAGAGAPTTIRSRTCAAGRSLPATSSRSRSCCWRRS